MVKDKSGLVVGNSFYSYYVTLVISTLAFTIKMVIDGVIVGQFLGSEAMAAYGFASPFFIILNSISTIFSVGVQTVCGNAMGRGDRKAANGIFNAALVSILGLGVVLLAVSCVFSGGLATLLGCSNTPEMAVVFSETKDYVFGMGLGIPIMFASTMLQPVSQLDGDRKRVLFATFCAAVINVGCDLVNVLFLGWGMFGIGLSCGIGFIGSLIIYLLHFRSKKANFFFSLSDLRWKQMGRVISAGLPTCVTRVCYTVRTVILNRAVVVIAGSIGVAAMSIQSNSFNVFGCVCTSLGSTVLLLVTVYFGEQDLSALKVISRRSLEITATIVVVVAVVLWFIAPGVTRVYINDPNVIALGTDAVRFLAISIPFNALNQIILNFAQGTGKLKVCYAFTILKNLVLTVLFAYLLSRFIGINGIWSAIIFSEIAMIVIYWLFAVIRKRSFRIAWRDLMLLPENFDVPDSQKVECSAVDNEGVMKACAAAGSLCQANSVDQDRTDAVIHCIEEMGTNIVRTGIEDPSRQRLDIKVMVKGSDIVIRLRDNCKEVNPLEYYKSSGSDDILEGIEIRIVQELAKDVQYISIMKLNNLRITL